MRLKDYAEQRGVSYSTAWRWFNLGYIKGKQLPTGTIILDVEDKPKIDPKVELIKEQLLKLTTLVEMSYENDIPFDLKKIIEKELNKIKEK